MSVEKQHVTRRESDLLWASHQKEHALHSESHEMEHKMAQEALEKADSILEKRLEGMNEFRSQLERQAGAFLTREIFEAYVKEQTSRVELALANNTEKYDTLIKAIVNRHDNDTDTLKDELQSYTDNLKGEIQREREIRKTFEGSINTWKWLATFLGASGVAGVIIMFATGTH